MEVYFRKRATPLKEKHTEITSKLMGKAKDIVRITLLSTSSTSMKPQENPKIIYDILRQHFSDETYSCMPMADFYSTVPATGETPVEYWLRLNKAVDAAEEGLKRLGRHMEDPCQEAVMMFVKYCPDPSFAAVFKFKAPEKWTAMRGCVGTEEIIDNSDIEQQYIKACAAAPTGAKVIVQNTQRLGPFDELFYTPVKINNSFQVQGMLDSGSMACTFSEQAER
ncbi:hypothetical protein N1851_030144 [Merluccius polli]|uniref:Uncharacterized protein n=1 Tax=Merluccius polli TaxID=89951 RepID=A0AA47M5V3_MERPO|nr:hypothetical protein N1851_030144 [Merluccius polli]